jgi:hypothetical protein
MPGTFFAAGIAATFGETLVPGTQVPQATVLEVDAGSGSCTVTQWTTPTTGQYTAAVVAQVSAGTITLAGGQKSAFLVPQVISLADGGSSVSYSLTQGSMLFGPGDTLTITASGETVPPFSAEITVPNAIALTQPDLRAPSLIIVRSMDLAVVWTGGGPTGDVTFGVIQDVGPTSTSVSCRSPASAGRGVIPASALGYLTASTASTSGSDGAAFGVYSSAVKYLTVQDWQIRIVAEPPNPVATTVSIEWRRPILRRRRHHRPHPQDGDEALASPQCRQSWLVAGGGSSGARPFDEGRGCWPPSSTLPATARRWGGDG